MYSNKFVDSFLALQLEALLGVLLKICEFHFIGVKRKSKAVELKTLGTPPDLILSVKAC